MSCSPAEIIERARTLLHDTHAVEIEVRMGELYMFTVDREMFRHVH